LSFWVRSNKIGTYSISLVNAGFDRAYNVEYTIAQANTWEKKVIVIPFTYSGGTWNYTNGRGLAVTFQLVPASQAAGSWLSGSNLYYGTPATVNFMDSTSNVFYLADVQLEAGSVPTEFERMPVDEVLRRCQRYYQVLGSGVIYEITAYAYTLINNYVVAPLTYPVVMRATPVPAVVGSWVTYSVYTSAPLVLGVSKSNISLNCMASSSTEAAFYSNGGTVTLDAEL
jgi:hypothetical protein